MCKQVEPLDFICPTWNQIILNENMLNLDIISDLQWHKDRRKGKQMI